MIRKSIFPLIILAWFRLATGQQETTPRDRATNTTPSVARSITWERGDKKLSPDHSGCNAENIDTTWLTRNHPIEIERHTIRMTEIGTSDVDFYIRNLEVNSIKAIALIIEYTDAQNRLIVRLPVVANTKQAGEAFRPPFPFERVESPWMAPIPNGGAVRVQGLSNGVRANVCPTHSRVTFAMVQFADDTIKTLPSRGWLIDPTPRVIPYAPEFPPDVVRPPISILARVKISASGQVTDVVAPDQEQPEVLNLIRAQMAQKWKFNPGLYDGSPITSEITVLFQIHSERTVMIPETIQGPPPVRVIDFFPDNRNPGKLQIAYGGLFSGSAVE